MLAIAPPLRVLIVEDDNDTAESTSLLFRALGCNAETATSGQLALEKAPVFHPDVMLIDLAMPGLDGCELANHFRHTASFGSTPLIAVSGFVDRKHRQQALDAGFDGFVSKPFSSADLENLCHRVRESLARATTAIETSGAAAARAEQLCRKCDVALDEFWLNRRPSD